MRIYYQGVWYEVHTEDQIHRLCYYLETPELRYLARVYVADRRLLSVA
jgi:hypothetical protein